MVWLKSPPNPVVYRKRSHTMSARTPSYRLHKATGQGIVTLSGKDFYLGRYNSPESKIEYDRVVAEWFSNGRMPPTPAETSATRTVSQIILAFLEHAQNHYRK